MYGSANQIASRAIFVLDTSNAEKAAVEEFCRKVEQAAEECGWLPKEDGKTQKVQLTEDNSTLTMEINTDVPLEYPMPCTAKTPWSGGCTSCPRRSLRTWS